jgi:hypothetical protein
MTLDSPGSPKSYGRRRPTCHPASRASRDRCSRTLEQDLVWHHGEPVTIHPLCRPDCLLYTMDYKDDDLMSIR